MKLQAILRVLAVFPLILGNASSQDQRAFEQRLQSRDKAGASQCMAAGEGYHQVAGYFCFSGELYPWTIEGLKVGLLSPEARGRALIIDSGGGDVVSAIELADLIRRRGMRLIVSNFCASSCANYVLPSAKRIGVLPYSLVVLHGSPPRTKEDYSAMVAEASRRQGAGVEVRPETFSAYRSSTLVPAKNLFRDAHVSNAYLRSYDENKKRILSSKCKLSKGYALIVDKNYVQKYTSAVVDYYWSFNENDYAKLSQMFPHFMRDYTITVGLSGRIVWDNGHKFDGCGAIS